MKTGKIITADLVIDFDTGIVEKSGEHLVLSDLTWRTLCCLAASEGSIVSVEELIEAVWGNLHVTNETVTQRIKLLRQELGDDGQNPKYIETVRNRGFRFLPLAKQTSETKYGRKIKSFMAFGAVIVLVIVFLTYYFQPAPEFPESAPTELARIIERGYEYLSRIQEEDNQIAISLFEEALERDGDDQRAMIGLSFAKTHNATKFSYPLDLAREGELLARRAIEIEANGSGYHALAFSLDAQGRIDEALNFYEKALGFEPENAAVLSSAAYLYQVRGKLNRAIDYGMRAHAIDPDLAFVEVQLAFSLHLLERDAEASKWLEQGLILKPDNIFIYSVKAQILFALGRDKAALETIDKALSVGISRPELFVLRGLIAVNDERMEDARDAFLLANTVSGSRKIGDPYLVWINLLLGTADVSNEAMAIITSVLEDEKADKTNPTSLVVVSGLFAAKKNSDSAFQVLQDAVEAGYRDWRSLRQNPMFASLQIDSRFEDIITQIRELITAES